MKSKSPTLRALKKQQNELHTKVAWVEYWTGRLLEMWAEKEGQDGDTFTYDTRTEAALRNFCGRIAPAEVEDAIHITFTRFPLGTSEYQRFKFFCGVCWRKIKTLKETKNVPEIVQ